MGSDDEKEQNSLTKAETVDETSSGDAETESPPTSADVLKSSNVPNSGDDNSASIALLVSTKADVNQDTAVIVENDVLEQNNLANSSDVTSHNEPSVHNSVTPADQPGSADDVSASNPLQVPSELQTKLLEEPTAPTTAEAVPEGESTDDKSVPLEENISPEPLSLLEDSTAAPPAQSEASATTELVRSEGNTAAEPVPPLEDEDMEDGELSDDDQAEETSSTEGVTESHATASLSTNPSSTDHRDDMPAPAAPAVPAVPTKRNRKSTESSDDQQDKGHSKNKEDGESSGSSSSSEEESRSERKRKKKEKERRKKEKKLKRKREKQGRKKRKRQRLNDDYEGSPPDGQSYGHQEYDTYDDRDRWRKEGMRSQSGPNRGFGGSERRYDYQGNPGYGGDRSPPGPYDSPGVDPYASPPDDSSEDEFSETLYSLVGDELMDPNVSAAEKEALFKKSQERIPGLSAGKMKKIMKNRQYREQQQMRHRQREQRDGRRRDRRDDMPREKTVKCKYYAEGKCQKGERCQFSHNFIPAKKMEACKFFLQGYCAKGDMCIYLHSEVPCKYYHTGQKCFNAEKCKFSHEPLSDSTRPLLEKAILLEETGTFKAERPSLLGSPPKELLQPRQRDNADGTPVRPTVQSFDPSDDEREEKNRDKVRERTPRMAPPPLSHIPSLFDLDLKPSAELMAKLESGLYEELTASLSDSDEDRFDSPPKRPQSFYSDTLATPDRPGNQPFSSGDPIRGSPSKKNRWGPDLPNQSSGADRFNQSHALDYYGIGGGDADRITHKKGPLLPIPDKPAHYSQPPLPVVNQPIVTSATGDINTSTAQVAAANLSKILNALRSTAVAATSRVADPRAAADPRAVVDPRAAPDLRTVADPRSAVDPRVPRPMPGLLPDPRSQLSHDPRSGGAIRNNSAHHMDNKPSLLPERMVTPIQQPVPEINGKFSRPMEFNLIPVYVEVRSMYIPPGAENSQEMLRDPRIKKRVLTMKKDGAPALPSLPDITADLQRIQNARIMSNSAPIAAPRLSSRASTDSISSIDPRRNSIENKHPYRGQGDYNSNSESITDNGTKPRNPARTMLSKVNPMASSYSHSLPTSSATYDDEDEEDNSLTIDMPEDRAMETAYT